MDKELTNYMPKLYTKPSLIHGLGVFSSTGASKGETLGFFEGHVVPTQTPYSLKLGDLHIEPIGILKQLNHSCVPNAHFDGRFLTASRDIEPNEEITISYLVTEDKIIRPFRCNCGNKECQGWIGKRVKEKMGFLPSQTRSGET